VERVCVHFFQIVKMRDLAESHGPVSNFTSRSATASGIITFSSPLVVLPLPIRLSFADAAELRKYELTQAQLDFYDANGYVQGIRVLSDAQVAQLLDETKKLMNLDDANDADDAERRKLFYEYHANETGTPDAVLFHCLGHWRISEGFHDVVFAESLCVPASQLLHGRVRFWHDQLFCKPPATGACVAWHQDYSYWTRTFPMNHLTIHIALDEQSPSNGCLHYIPGSHRWPLLPITTRHFNDMDSIKTLLNDEQLAQWKPVPMLLKPGEAAFHHPLIVHGSFGNRSAHQWRRAAVVNYFADGTRSNGEMLLDGVPCIQPDHPLDGSFFPLVFDPATYN
jgi:ectoine hydroxylase-related dioxygenase (phytanoyl-CoA dioxygenase family)